ncbi:hypothetical protein, partial [Micromonospora sp. NPDC005324]|uniref:hypothetical protein n=1 Tax=Micromonospora sp. NPDC005324 TaxID=3157033 RepID=UPI0033A0CA69
MTLAPYNATTLIHHANGRSHSNPVRGSGAARPTQAAVPVQGDEVDAVAALLRPGHEPVEPFAWPV